MVLASTEQPLSTLGQRPNPRCLHGYEWNILQAEQNESIYVGAEKHRHFLKSFDPSYSLHTESYYSDLFLQAYVSWWSIH